MTDQQETVSLTFSARRPEPHLHLDNRALIVHDGNRTLRIGRSSFPWILETLQVLAEEGRASRSSGQQFAGGFASEDGSRTLYFGIGEDFAAVTVDGGTFDALREALERASHR